MGITGPKHRSGFGDDAEFGAPDIVAEINITPLTDIFLVLLIIFMVTSSVLSQMGVQVQLPKSKGAAEASSSPGVVVTVTAEGSMLVNGAQVSEGSLGSAMRSALEKSANKTIVLEGDRRALLGTIVQVMDEGKRAGADKFAVATSGGGVEARPKDSKPQK